MKRLRLSRIIILITLLAGACWAQSLPQAARAARQSKKAATKVYTNDDIPESRQLWDEEKADTAENSQTSDQEQGGENEAPTSEKHAANKAVRASAKTGDDEADRREQLKGDLAEQQKKVADLEREINLMEREHKLKVAAFYADAGTQLRDSKKWFEEERAYQTDLESKKKDLQDTKQKLEDLQEEARKAGVSSPQPE